MDIAFFNRAYQAARAEGPLALAAFLGLCTVYAGRARQEISAGLEEPQRRKPPSGPLLITAKEAAEALGPSFNAKKLYRLASGMSPFCAVRKGGRLYFNLSALRQWAEKQ